MIIGFAVVNLKAIKMWKLLQPHVTDCWQTNERHYHSLKANLTHQLFIIRRLSEREDWIE